MAENMNTYGFTPDQVSLVDLPTLALWLAEQGGTGAQFPGLRRYAEDEHDLQNALMARMCSTRWAKWGISIDPWLVSSLYKDDLARIIASHNMVVDWLERHPDKAQLWDPATFGYGHVLQILDKERLQMAEKVKATGPKVGIAPTTATAEECALWLAERVCPICAGTGLEKERDEPNATRSLPTPECDACHGTGAWFPELRQPHEHNKPCHPGCLGWVPVVDLETLMESARRADIPLTVYTFRHLDAIPTKEKYGAFCNGVPHAYGDSPTLAAYRAVVLRMMAQP